MLPTPPPAPIERVEDAEDDGLCVFFLELRRLLQELQPRVVLQQGLQEGHKIRVAQVLRGKEGEGGGGSSNGQRVPSTSALACGGVVAWCSFMP